MLMNSGSHIIDVLLWTTGLTPLEVKPALDLQGAPVEIDSFTSIRFAEGAVAGLNVVGYAPCQHEVQVPGSFALKVVKFTEMVYEAAGYKPLLGIQSPILKEII